MNQPPKALWSEPWRDVAPPELVAALSALGHSRRLVDGELLYARGDRSQDLIGVRSGLIRMIGSTADGYEGLLGLYRPGTWFGEMSFFDALPRPADAYAVGDTEVLIVPAAPLREVLDRHPVWYREFARVLCHKLRVALVHIESSFLPPQVRIAIRLLDLAEAYGRPVEAGIEIDLSLPQEDLARMLGLTRQSVNKELRVLQAQGGLQVRRGRITLTAPDALRQRVRDAGGGDLL
ncbi:Crp/Fnr family transcriptional regulator [Sinimarinibacterium sp. CAU 1509]|uniref:Crp/Fnr family transcriptional regulator n=1 Tax=Sinimarinibacterium sp. CAU 1509 TaxID=2562283 RepID=UPI0010AD7C0A|nr:Crp/Fnr family transcriptional regulator [Sinimarinibacterium sp. CAU 1509]TJY64686.1 Crp/Fnr family transcriptional regulator [Sinimarinibacterium sp. CAU 1509]